MTYRNCCHSSKRSKKCKRKNDGKIFKLPRKFSKHKCLTGNVKGYSMKSSCAPFKGCKRSQFLYHPDNPDKSFDVYINKNPDDTIPIKYTTVKDVDSTIKKLERLYKTRKYTHKRIWQVGMIMKVRLESMLKHKKKFPNAKHIKERYILANKYFKHLGKRTKLKEHNRRKFKFIHNQ